MSRSMAVLATAATLVCMTGCYHQTVNTGLSPAPGPVINKTAGVSFWGLSGAEVDATRECPNGVAVVETQQTFLNGLIAGLTLGLYTPQTVSITCAAGNNPAPGGLEVSVGMDATPLEVEAAARKAVQLAKDSRQPVILRYLP